MLSAHCQDWIERLERKMCHRHDTRTLLDPRSTAGTSEPELKVYDTNHYFTHGREILIQYAIFLNSKLILSHLRDKTKIYSS